MGGWGQRGAADALPRGEPGPPGQAAQPGPAGQVADPHLLHQRGHIPAQGQPQQHSKPTGTHAPLTLLADIGIQRLTVLLYCRSHLIRG